VIPKRPFPEVGDFVDFGGFLYGVTAVVYRYEDTSLGKRTVISVEWTSYGNRGPEVEDDD
jgi:hypothetical protein